MSIEDFSLNPSELAERVLIVAGDPTLAAKISATVSRRRYQSETVTTLSQANELSLKSVFDALIVDNVTKATELSKLVSALGDFPGFRRAGILILNEDQPAEWGNSEHAENIQVLTAPFEPIDLLMKLARQLRQRKIRAEQANFNSMLTSQNMRLRDLTARFQRELIEAQQVQRAILPKDLPLHPRARFAAEYIPLEAVGGDLYNIWTVDENRFGLFIADVTGHGLPAAFIGAMTKMALSYAEKQSASQVLKAVNDGLCPLMPEGRFVTAAVAILDAKSGELSVARAGHPPGVYFKRSTGETQLITPRGIPLGIAPDMRFEETIIKLDPGDRFILITDGITETQNLSGKMLGNDGVKKLISDSAKIELLDAALKQVIAGQRLFSEERLIKDDITLIGLEFFSDNKS
jgi:serine phosphatase RsbU (regulator of sigma subunit)